MNKPETYTLSSRGMTTTFTVDNIIKEDRERLAKELAALNDRDSESSVVFMYRHMLVGRAFEALARDYPTVGQLAQASDKDLLTRHSFGKRKLYYLREALRNNQ